MSHEIYANDKVFTVGARAWHGLDDNKQGPRLTAAEAQTYLAWTVKKVPALYEGKEVDGAFYTVREDTNEVLGVVGSKYAVIQNEWLFKLLDPVVDQADCIYETGGSLMNGKKVWALAKLPGEYYIIKDDKIHQYILVTIAHDGTMMFTAMHTAIRVVCNNTLTAALSMGGRDHPVVQIKHTPGYKFQIQIAHKILGMSTKASTQAATFFAQLAVKAMDTKELTEFAKYVFPSVRDEQGKEADERIQRLRNRLYIGFEAPINNLDPEHKFTAWSAYNAYTDILDHGEVGRKGTDKQHWSWYGAGPERRLKAITWLKHLISFKALPEPEPTIDPDGDIPDDSDKAPDYNA